LAISESTTKFLLLLFDAKGCRWMNVTLASMFNLAAGKLGTWQVRLLCWNLQNCQIEAKSIPELNSFCKTIRRFSLWRHLFLIRLWVVKFLRTTWISCELMVALIYTKNLLELTRKTSYVKISFLHDASYTNLIKTRRDCNLTVTVCRRSQICIPNVYHINKRDK